MRPLPSSSSAQELCDERSERGVQKISRKKPILKNRISPEIETAQRSRWRPGVKCG